MFPLVSGSLNPENALLAKIKCKIYNYIYYFRLFDFLLFQTIYMFETIVFTVL